MKMNENPDCALFWEGDMYIYQKAKNRSKSFSFLNLFDKYRNSQNENNKIKLWKTPCHVELHQMELYITLLKNGINSNTIDRTIYLNEKTRVSLLERNLQKSLTNSLKPPYLFINQNIQEKESCPDITNTNNFFLQDEAQSSSSASTFNEEDNHSNHFYTNFNEEQT